MSYRVALVGAGPTALYTLQALLTLRNRPEAITVFERQGRAGPGTPYSAHWSDPIMLANIASIEIPALTQSLIDWLHAQSDERLHSFGISRENIDDRAFYPRLVLGEYLAAQFVTLVERARSLGIEIDVYTRVAVTDVDIVGEKIRLTHERRLRTNNELDVDYCILATGHQWPPDPEVRVGYFTSPWPASALKRIRNCAVGLRGTALSAIDAAVALAHQHGEFFEAQNGELTYQSQPGSELFTLTMFSRKGLLPEADFYHPIPYEPLAVCTVQRMEELIDAVGSASLLDEAFELFRRELLQADGMYAKNIGLQRLSLEEFCEAYFAQRANLDPFEWARTNLIEAQAHSARQFTVQWRYAILRMHEVFGLIAPHLSDADFARFSGSLKKVFVDNYATVPHASIRRLLALHAAGKLFVHKLTAGMRLDTRSPSHGADLINGNRRIHFPVFIEATGQQILSAQDFPFPSLRRRGVVRDESLNDRPGASRGIAIDGHYHPISNFESSRRLFCLSLPFLLGDHPFAQGITSSAEMAGVVAEAIEDAESTNTAGRPGAASQRAIAQEP